MIYLNDLIQPLNGLITRILKSRLHWPLSNALIVVSWAGRKSGRPFSIPVGYQAEDDTIIVMISKPGTKVWWKNFRTPWPADLIIRGRRRAAMGELIEPGGVEFFARCEQTLQRLPFMDKQFGGLDYDAAAGLDDSQRALLVEHAGAVRFELLD